MAQGDPSRAELGRVVIGADRIAARIPELAREITERMGDGPDDLVIVPVMTGAFIFAADLVRHMPMRMRITLATVSSYPGTSTVSQGVRPLGELPARGAFVLALPMKIAGGTGGPLRIIAAVAAPQ